MLQRKAVLVPGTKVVIPDQNTEDGKYKMELLYKQAGYWSHNEKPDFIQVLM